MFNPASTADALAALPFCCHTDDGPEYLSSGCPACPFRSECIGISPSWVYAGIARVLADLPQSALRDRYADILSSCSDCMESCERECDASCPYYAEFGEPNAPATLRRILAYLKDSGVYPEAQP